MCRRRRWRDTVGEEAVWDRTTHAQCRRAGRGDQARQLLPQQQLLLTEDAGRPSLFKKVVVLFFGGERALIEGEARNRPAPAAMFRRGTSPSPFQNRLSRRRAVFRTTLWWQAAAFALAGSCCPGMHATYRCPRLKRRCCCWRRFSRRPRIVVATRRAK